MAVVVCLLGGLSLAGNVDLSLADVTMTPDTTIPFKSEGPSFVAMLAKLLVGTVVGIGLAVAAGYAIKRGFYQIQQTGQIKTRITVREAKRIAPRMTVFIVNIDEQEHKIVQSGDQLIELRNDSKRDGNANAGVQRDEP